MRLHLHTSTNYRNEINKIGAYYETFEPKFWTLDGRPSFLDDYLLKQYE
jgi:hypothetical protein